MPASASLPKPYLACVAFLFGASNAGFALADETIPDGIKGRWVTEGFGSIVELHACPHRTHLLCGRIVWLWEPIEAGRPRSDRKNPDASKRSRPLVGAEILTGFAKAAPGEWTGGEVYNPDDGRTYSGSISLRAPGRLELEGCTLFGVLCASQAWYRPEALISQTVSEAE